METLGSNVFVFVLFLAMFYLFNFMSKHQKAVARAGRKLGSPGVTWECLAMPYMLTLDAEMVLLRCTGTLCAMSALMCTCAVPAGKYEEHSLPGGERGRGKAHPPLVRTKIQSSTEIRGVFFSIRGGVINN